MRNYLILALFFCAISFAQAQLSTYDISTYVRPDLERRTFSIRPDFVISNQYLKEENQDTINTVSPLLNNSLSLGITPSLYITYFKNTEKVQKNFRNRLDIDIGYNKNSLEDDVSVSVSDFDLELEYSSNYSRKEFMKNQWFWELGYEAYGRYSYLSSKDKYAEQTKQDRASIRFNPTLYYGKGRIEVVSDAWHAQTILEILAENEILKIDPTTEQITHFANRISTIKNFRNTDLRLENIAEYESLVEYFITNDWVDADNYRFFALLNDAWQYESFIIRHSGTEFKGGLGMQAQSGVSPLFTDTPISSTFNIKPYLFLQMPIFSLHYNSYKPLSEKIQFNHWHSIAYQLATINIGIDDLTDIDGFLNTISSVRLSSIWQIQYLPNLRTNYTASAQLYSSFIKNSDSAFSDIDYSYTTFRLDFRYRYYVSPQFSYSISASSDFYNRAIDRPYWGIRNSIRVGAVYSFY